MGNLELKDVYFGDPDAKYEMISGSERDIKRFFDSYMLPTNLLLDDFLEGRTMYIKGLKGTGKTALLRYIGMEATNRNYISSFILFRTEFDKQDKQDFAHAARVIVTNFEEDDDSVSNKEEDYALVWRWFLHKQIVYTLEEENQKNGVFKRNPFWDKYKKLVKVVDPSEYSEKRFPVLTKGNVKIDARLLDKFGVGLDLEFENKTEHEIKFSTIVKRIDNAFKKLNVDIGKLFILLDELELSYSTTKEYNRDIKIISGLILASKQIYSVCLERSFPVKFICAIRSEVVRAISFSGQELNKEIEGFGFSINWHNSSQSIKEHPLIGMISKRIETAEKEHGLKPNRSGIISEYFDKTIQGIDIEKYIIDQTWERPRDIVRLLSLAKRKFPNTKFISHAAFDTIRKEYAVDAWSEFKEELRAKYDPNSIEAIYYSLTGIIHPFLFEDYKREIAKKSALFPDYIPDLVKNNDLITILQDLYRIGVIGNQGFRFVYKGYDQLIPTNPIVIHRALWSHFSPRRNPRFHL